MKAVTKRLRPRPSRTSAMGSVHRFSRVSPLAKFAAALITKLQDRRPGRRTSAAPGVVVKAQHLQPSGCGQGHHGVGADHRPSEPVAETDASDEAGMPQTGLLTGGVDLGQHGSARRSQLPAPAKQPERTAADADVAVE